MEAAKNYYIHVACFGTIWKAFPRKGLLSVLVGYNHDNNRLAVLLGNSHGHSLHLGVVVQSVLPELSADARLLVAAEWCRGGESVVGVDPDGPGPQGVADVHCLAEVLSEHSRGQSVVVPDNKTIVISSASLFTYLFALSMASSTFLTFCMD